MTDDNHLLRFAIDIDELAVRLIEARAERLRPANCTAQEIMDAFPPEEREWMIRQAQAAADYVVEECLHAQRLQ